MLPIATRKMRSRWWVVARLSQVNKKLRSTHHKLMDNNSPVFHGLTLIITVSTWVLKLCAILITSLLLLPTPGAAAWDRRLTHLEAGKKRTFEEKRYRILTPDLTKRLHTVRLVCLIPKSSNQKRQKVSNTHPTSKKDNSVYMEAPALWTHISPITPQPHPTSPSMEAKLRRAPHANLATISTWDRLVVVNKTLNKIVREVVIVTVNRNHRRRWECQQTLTTKTWTACRVQATIKQQ